MPELLLDDLQVANVVGQDRRSGMPNPVCADERRIFGQLAVTPFSFARAGDAKRSTRRELIVSAGSTGYVTLHEIAGPDDVLVLAVRHQREDDYR